MYLTLTDLLLLTSIIQALSLAGFLLLPSASRLLSNRLLAATLVFFAAGLAEIFLYGSGLALDHPNLAYLGTLVGLLQAGGLYLYAQALMYRDFRLRRGHLVHTLLFWVVAAIFLVEYYLQPPEVKLSILMQRDHPGVVRSPLLAVAIHAVFLGYLYATLRALNRFGIGLRRLFSNIENKQLAWLRMLLLGYAAAWSVSMFYCMAAHLVREAPGAHWVAGAGALIGFAFINVVTVYALRQPGLFSGLAADQLALIEEEERPGADAELKARLEHHMRQHRPHLNPNLSLEQIARQLRVHPRELSRTINQGLGCNFFEFINGYRLQAAREQLEDASNQATILEVMYAAGFNSKSVFNTAFKRSTGLTPSQYRRRSRTGPAHEPAATEQGSGFGST